MSIIKSDEFGDRMKKMEVVWKQKLPIRMPIIMRLDGKSFHTYTRGCDRPFDAGIEEVMNLTAIELCKTIQGAQIAYIQSDEISILIHTYKTYKSNSWFDSEIQKMCSVSAAVASTTFTLASDKIKKNAGDKKPAYFDSRVFVVPESEVNNVFYWRQKDATRNSISMLAQSLYSQKELNGKSSSQQQEMCFVKGINWNNLPTTQKRGRCIAKEYYTQGDSTRSKWVVDSEIPIFSQDKNYISKYLATEDDE